MLIHSAQVSPEEIGGTAVSAVVAASQLVGTGQPVTTGTLEAPTVPGGEWSYSPAPEDALVYVDAELETRSFKFAQISGDLSSMNDFVGGAHQLAFTLSDEDQELTFASHRVDGRLERRMWGTAVLGGRGCSVDLADSDWRLSKRSGGERQDSRQNNWSGMLTCGRESFAYAESWNWSASSGEASSSEHSERALNYYWGRESEVFRLPEGRIDVARDALGVNVFFASGQLLRGEAPIGGIAEERKMTGHGDIYTAWLVTGDGRFQIGPEVVSITHATARP